VRQRKGEKDRNRQRPVLLSPNSRGQEIAKERNHTTAIIRATLLLELYLVLYSMGIATAVYLHTHTCSISS
jgi:hypothetical protein